MSHDVSLPKDHTPEFPDVCVRCLRPQPDSSFVPQGGAVSWWTAFLLFTPGRRVKPIAPACRSCARWMRWMRRFRLLGWLVVIAIAVVGSIALRKHVTPTWPRWVGYVYLVLLMAPYFVFNAVIPPHYDVTEFPKTILYEFKSRVYAMLFAAHNSTTRA
jgi:hypothetical protein